MHVLLYDDLGRLTLRRLRPWDRVLARSRAAQLDHELADGMNPETSATLAYLFEQQRCSIASVFEFRSCKIFRIKVRLRCL